MMLEIQKDPINDEDFLERGRMHCRRDEFDLAIRDLTKVTQLTHDLGEVAEAQRLLAISYDALGDSLSLISCLDWLIENGFADEMTYMWRGNQHKWSDNFSLAMEDFKKALEIKPEYEPALMNRAQMYYQLNQYEQAEHEYSQILGMNNQHPNHLKIVFHWRGMARYQLRKIEQASEDFNEVLRLREDKLLTDISEYLALSSDGSWFCN